MGQRGLTRVELTVEGTPPRKNERHEIVAPRGKRPFLVNSDAFESFVLRFTNRWRRAGMPRIRSGLWSIEIRAFWTKQRHLDLSMPIGDIDAPTSAVLDALQACGCVDNDVRFVSERSDKFIDRENPRVEIVLAQLEAGAEQLQLEGDDDG